MPKKMETQVKNTGRAPEKNGDDTVLSLIGEIILVFFKMFIEILIATYRLVIPPAEKDIKGEIVLVTGAGHGIGKELALQYAAQGSTVVCWDINKKNNDQTVKEIIEMGYPKAYSYECDVSKREHILEVAEKVKKDVGNVTILVNNAGIMPTHSLMEHTNEEIRKIFDINVLAHFWMFEAFLPSMIENNHGHLVALSSMAGIVGLHNLVPYCSSKFAVRGMMEALHEELRENNPKNNIKITCIYPFMVDTGLCKKPKVRFPDLLKPIPTKTVAQKIVDATKRNYTEVSIPGYMFTMNSIFRLFPTKVPMIVKDFTGSGVDSDL